MVRDDGIGIRVGRVLRELDLPVTVELRRCMGLELLDELRADERIIVVDATRTGRAAGTCHVLDLTRATSLASQPYCCHGMGLVEVLDVVSRVAPERIPPRLVIVGIEAGDLTEYGTSLSPPVRDALPEAVDLVLETIDAPAALRERGRAEAERMRDWVPSITDIIDS
jgi:hydrogenase maturation protease